MPTTPQPDMDAPKLDVPLTIGEHWSLSKQSPDAFTMIVVYRGLHCPMCKKYLKELAGMVDEFSDKGFNLVAVSMDDEERAKKAYEEWELGDLPIGYDMTEEQANAWGLYVSQSIKDAEPKTFAEPGLFWVRPDGRLYLVDVSNSPFARPSLSILLDKAGWIVENDYPARGVKAA